MNYVCIELKTNDEGGTAADVLYTGKDRNYAESVGAYCASHIAKAV